MVDCHTSITELSERTQSLSERISRCYVCFHSADPVVGDSFKVIFRLHHSWNTEKEGTP